MATMKVKAVPGAVTIPKGFKAAAVQAGIKYNDRFDLALIASDVDAVTAGVFTTNKVKAWPVLIDIKHLAYAAHRAILVNSGNANCSNGDAFYEKTKEVCYRLADEMSCAASGIFPSSTGVIGRAFPVERIVAQIPALVAGLSREKGHDAARAILTTDTRTKEALVTTVIGGKKVSIAAIGKGAGMLHPNMATMLVFITTDAAISKKLLQEALSQCTEKTYNCLNVDNDMSTNDTVLMMANGCAGNTPITKKGAAYAQFCAALEALSWYMSKELVRDGEGVTKVCTLEIQGARTEKEAVCAARTLATSMLFKTALHGADPNWGRIVAALGAQPGIHFSYDALSIYFGKTLLFKKGVPYNAKLAQAKKELQKNEVTIGIDLGVGRAQARFITSDLSKQYISINADYTT